MRPVTKLDAEEELQPVRQSRGLAGLPRLAGGDQRKVTGLVVEAAAMESFDQPETRLGFIGETGSLGRFGGATPDLDRLGPAAPCSVGIGHGRMDAQASRLILGRHHSSCGLGQAQALIHATRRDRRRYGRREQLRCSAGIGLTGGSLE
jgi:hypothetical protein